MIHCDEVFDILTRGPFPTGAPSDGIVEAHLNHCEACRQLAEALRPAIELLQEAISPEESNDLPRYGGVAQPRAMWTERGPSPLKTKPLVARPVARVAAKLRRTSEAWPWRSAAKFVVAACVGLALAGMLRQVVLSRDVYQRPVPTPVALAAAWRSDLDPVQWAGQQRLGPRCRETIAGYTFAVSAGDPTAEDTIQLTCCTGCHAARAGQILPAHRVSSFVLACQACH
jgi:hypothetical protein